MGTPIALPYQLNSSLCAGAMKQKQTYEGKAWKVIYANENNCCFAWQDFKMFFHIGDDDGDDELNNRIRLGHIVAALTCITICFSKEESRN